MIIKKILIYSLFSLSFSIFSSCLQLPYDNLIPSSDSIPLKENKFEALTQTQTINFDDFLHKSKSIRNSQISDIVKKTADPIIFSIGSFILAKSLKNLLIPTTRSMTSNILIASLPYIAGAGTALLGVYVFIGREMKLIIQHQKTISALENSLSEIRNEIPNLKENHLNFKLKIDSVSSQLAEIQDLFPKIKDATKDNAKLASALAIVISEQEALQHNMSEIQELVTNLATDRLSEHDQDIDLLLLNSQQLSDFVEKAFKKTKITYKKDSVESDVQDLQLHSEESKEKKHKNGLLSAFKKAFGK